MPFKDQMGVIQVARKEFVSVRWKEGPEVSMKRRTQHIISPKTTPEIIH